MSTIIELKDILNNPNDKLIAVDLDGTLCDGVWWGDGDEPKVRDDMRNYVWSLYRRGAHIVIYTARQPRYYAKTHAWLVANEIPFHGITMAMKPGADVYIDDCAINVEDIII